jgi:hypothetical protein
LSWAEAHKSSGCVQKSPLVRLLCNAPCGAPDYEGLVYCGTCRVDKGYKLQSAWTVAYDLTCAVARSRWAFITHCSEPNMEQGLHILRFRRTAETRGDLRHCPAPITPYRLRVFDWYCDLKNTTVAPTVYHDYLIQP